MTITRRLAAMIASGLALAAAPEAGAWKPRSAASRVPVEPTPSAPPQTTPDQAETSVQPLAPTPGQLAVVTSTLVLAAAAAWGAWMLIGPDSSSGPGKPKPGASAPQPAALASSQIAACPLQPVTAVAGKKDGKFPLQAGVTGLVATDIASFIVIGKEAAAAGRPRDAEVAFLMACQVADQLEGIDSVESAEARYQLGSHYSRLALDGSPVTAPNRDQLRNRAERLYSDSLHLYHFNYVQAREKPAFPSQEPAPAPAQPTLALGENVQPVPAAEKPEQESATQSAEPVRPAAKTSSKPAGTALARAQPGKVVLAKTALPAPPRQSAATLLRPSFDCSKARSVSEKMICSDAELARRDRELGQLHARAKNAASDRVAFQRRQDQEWRRREALCRDRECLLRWYAQRRHQLTAVMERRGRSQAPAPRRGRFPDEMASLYKGH